MAALAKQSGAAYVHVLQPNQYVSKKPMSPEEQRRAINPARSGTEFLRVGYAKMRERGEELKKQGIVFHDASGIFGAVPEPVFADECCHLNQTGNRLLAKDVAEVLAARR